MQEVLPGLYHWDTPHPKIGIEVASYWLEPHGVLLDPLVPADAGLEWFESRPIAVAAILLSNRHHYRHSALFAERFGCPVYCNRLGLHEFTHGEQVEAFDVGDTLVGGITVQQMGGICPDDSALHIPHLRALLIADAVVNGSPHGQAPRLGFVPDQLMDDPPQTKRTVLASCERLLEQLEFEHLLLAHGGPVIDEGRTLLAELVQVGGRAAFEM